MFSLGSSTKSVLRDYEIYVDSPYDDIILIQGSPLENESTLVTGTIKFNLLDDITVRRVQLKLIGTYKLEFLQMGKSSGLASIVKQKSPIFESTWDNLLTDRNGKVSMNPKAVDGNTIIPKLSLSKTFRRSTKSKDITVNSVHGNTPFPNLQEDEYKYYYKMKTGEYEIPFSVELPHNVLETIEGLQSGSILYNFECFIDRRRRKNNDLTSHSTDVTLRKFKYLRILRTLSMDNLAMHEEMKVGNTVRDKIQYEISIPSRAIPIGSKTMVSIKLFPFAKNYTLERISVTLLQYYCMSDLQGEVYDDEVVIFRQSMTEFGNLVDTSSNNNKLVGPFKLETYLQMPDNLKKVTQHCDNETNSMIIIRHKLRFQVLLRRDGKTMEIKATLPILLYISPQVPINGRLVLFDQIKGTIHFRRDELVPLFHSSSNPNSNPNYLTPYHFVTDNNNCANGENSLPPPNYEDRTNDRLIQHVTAPQQQLAIPTYEETMQYATTT